MTEQKPKKGNGIAKKLRKNILSPCIKSQSQKGKHPNTDKHDIDTIDNGTLSFDSTRYLKKKNSDLDTISSTVSLHSNRTESKLNNEITDSDPSDYLRRKQPKNKGKEKVEVTEIDDIDSSDSEDDVPLSKLTKKQTPTPLKNGENIEEIEESSSDVIKIPEFPMPVPSNTEEFFMSIPAKMEPTRSEMGSLVDASVVKNSIPMPQPTDSKYDDFSTPVNDNNYIIEEIVTEEIVNGKKIITTQTITRRANKSNYSIPLDNVRANEQASIKMPVAVGSSAEEIKIPAKMTPTKIETTSTTEGIVEMPMNIPKPSTSKLFTNNGVPNLVESNMPLSEIVNENDPNAMAMPSIPQIPPEEPQENITDNMVSSPKLIEEEIAFDPQQSNQPMFEPGFNINVPPPNQPVEAGFNFASAPPQDPAIDAGYYQQPPEPGFSFTVTNEDNMAIPLPVPGGHGNEHILNNVQAVPNLLATDSANRKEAKQQGFLNIPQPLPPSAIEDNQVIEDDKSDVSYGSKKIVVSSPKSFNSDEQIHFSEQLTKKQELEHEEALKNEKPIGTITMPKTPSTFFKNNNINYNENDLNDAVDRGIVEEESKNIISNIPDVESISDSDSETDSSTDDSSSDSETESSTDSDSSDDEKLFNIKQKYDQKKKEHEEVANKEKNDVKEVLKETKEDVKEELKETKEDIKEELKETKEDIKEELKETKEDVKEELKETKEDIKEEVKETKDDVKEELKEVKDDVKEELKEVKDDAKEELKEVKENVKEEIKEVKDDAKEELKEVKENVKEEIKETKEEVKKNVNSKENNKNEDVVGNIELANLDAVSEASFQDNLMGSLKRKNGARSIRSFFGFSKKDKKDKNDKNEKNKQQLKKEEKKEEKQQQKKEEKQQLKKEEKQLKKEEKQLKKEEKRLKKEEKQKLKREEAMSELPELPELPESSLAASDTLKTRRSSIRSFNEAHFSLKRLVSPFNRRSSSMKGRPTKEVEKTELSEANTTPEKPLSTEVIQDSDVQQVEKPVNDHKVNDHDKKETIEPVKLENVDKKDNDDQSSISSSDSDDSKSISSSSSDEEVLGNIIQKKNVNQTPNSQPTSNKQNVDVNKNYTNVENDDFVSLMMVQRMLSSSVDRSSSPIEIPELPKPVVNPYNVDVEYERRKSYSKPKAVVTAITPRNETETQRSTVLYKFEDKPERPISSFYKNDFASRSLGSLPVAAAAAETNEYSPKQRMIELNLDTSKDSITGPIGENDINNKSTILDSDLKQMFEDIHNLSLDDITSRYTKDSMIQCDIGPSFMDEVMGSLSMK